MALLGRIASLYSEVMKETYATMCRITKNPPPAQHLDVIACEHDDPNFWKPGQSDFILKLHEEVMNNPILSGPLKKTLKAAAKSGKKFVVFPSTRVPQEEVLPRASGVLELTAKDRMFLKSLRISTDDPVVLNPTANSQRDKQR